MVTKIGRVLISGRMFSTQTLKLSKICCYISSCIREVRKKKEKSYFANCMFIKGRKKREIPKINNNFKPNFSYHLLATLNFIYLKIDIYRINTQ